MSSSDSTIPTSDYDHNEITTEVCSLSGRNCGAPSSSGVSTTVLKLPVDQAAFYGTELTPVNCSFGVVQAVKEKRMTISHVVRKERSHTAAKQRPVVLAYVLRHPACAACRETGLRLSQYVAKEPTLSFFTVVKELGVVDTAILEYFSDYGGHNPLYQDRRLGIYKAMGAKQVSVWELVFGMPRVWWRSRKTKVAANLRETGGDAWTRGVVLIFDGKGKLAEVVSEPTVGEKLDMEEIHDAVQKAKRST